MNALGVYQSLFDVFLLNCGFAFSQFIVLRAGVFSIASAAYAAIGGYATAILVTQHGVPAPGGPTVAAHVEPCPTSCFAGAGRRTGSGALKPCCWPIGDPGTPGFRFCDEPALAAKPYCEEHACRAYAHLRRHDKASRAGSHGRGVRLRQPSAFPRPRGHEVSEPAD